MKIVIGHLYGDLMNTYGDDGNIITLTKRCEWRGIDVEVKNISVKDKLKNGEIDLYFFGGGQDQSQSIVAEDLQTKADIIREDLDSGVPLLSICGGYQLLGEYYAPFDGEKLMGINIFPAYTNASHDRMIGNIVIELKSSELRVMKEDLNSSLNTRHSALQLVGFENHSGKTYLKESAQALGQVIKGFGNNGEDGTEGCIYKNAIGCYMHGSLLPKNPTLADWLIKTALEIKYKKEVQLEHLDDTIENNAHSAIISRL